MEAGAPPNGVPTDAQGVPNSGVPNDASFQQDLRNQDPAFLVAGMSYVIGTIQAYGWFLVAVVVIAMYLHSKLRPKLVAMRQSTQDGIFKKSDVNASSERAEAMAAARQRMQEKLDKQAEVAKQKQAEKEEQKRLEKIENYELQQQGKSKLKPKVTTPEAPKAGGSKGKKSLKDDYSPLMGGGGGSCAWRPARRGPSAGGG